MQIKIVSRWDSTKVLFEGEFETLANALAEAARKGADLRGAYLQGADLKGADLQGADLQGADLQGADLRGAYLQGADLQGADLRGAYLRGADLRGADLRGAYLRGAYLRGADLRGADLRGAYLRGADLRGADLQGADLRGADLRGAYLQGADLRGADLRGADLQGVKVDENAVVTTSGETLKQWRETILPALLAAAPNAISATAWQCHSWNNCPMAEAFGVHSPSDVPPLYRTRVDEFVWLFDAGLITAEHVAAKAAEPVEVPR